MPLPQTLLLLLISMTSALHTPPQNLTLLSQPLPFSVNNATIPPLDTWRPLTLRHSTFHTLKTLQKNRLHMATHPHFEKPVLIKLDALNEVPAYRLLHGSGATPKFYGFVTDGNGDVPIGFITEYIDNTEGEVGGGEKEGCLAALNKVHERGIAHGDAHDGNCLLREDGSGVWVDFELFVEGSKEEVERDLDILGRCLEFAG